jgi:hypothetical protein
MTKGELIYDWRIAEGSFRDKLAAFAIVAVGFAMFFGVFQVRYVAPRADRTGSASVIRFRNDDLGRYWMLQAEENGPFPGRLDFGERGASLATEGLGGSGIWNDYRSQLRPLGDEGGDLREDLASKAVRVFPSRAKPGAVTPVPKELRQKPILTTYDSQALAWLPDKLPGFEMPEGAESSSAPWRFTLNLGEDGSVREAISIGGGDDAGQVAMERWLQGVRFKPAEGDRWLGLRVDFVNQPGDGPEP